MLMCVRVWSSRVRGWVGKVARVCCLRTQNWFWCFPEWTLRNFALYTLPGLRVLLTCPPSLRNYIDCLRIPRTGLLALVPKAPKEDGWHPKDLEVLLLFWLLLLDLCVSLFHNVYSRKCLVNTYWTEQVLSRFHLPIGLCVCVQFKH